jgi:chaperone modulatory protein CbpM
MKLELTEVCWLDAQQELTLAELAALSGLSEAELRELADYGAIVPRDPQAEPLMFGADCLVTARTACRLRADFELDMPGLALALALLGRIRNLEAQLHALSAMLPERPRRYRP